MKYYVWLSLFFIACRAPSVQLPMTEYDTLPVNVADTALYLHSFYKPEVSDSGIREKIVSFAATQLGVPYNFGCQSPDMGFDCSGFVTYVFKHFQMEVPRSSVDFTDKGKEVPLEASMPGDLILFTGTQPKIRTVGHIGIIYSNEHGVIHFIHASSGKENCVIITEMNDKYRIRFMKTISIL